MKEIFILDNYYILEKSQELKQYQLQVLQEKLPIELFKKITWVEEFIDQFNGVIIANELFDAIPTDVFSSFENEIMEKKVRVDNQNFSWALSENKKQFDYQLSLGDGAFDFEYSPGYHKILQNLLGQNKWCALSLIMAWMKDNCSIQVDLMAH